MKNIQLLIDGMSCAACSAAVEKALRRTDGVQEACVNLATGTALVTTDPARSDAAVLVKAVQKAGFGCRAVNPEEESVQKEEEKKPSPLRRMLLLLPFAIPLLYLAHASMLPLPFADFLGSEEFAVYNAGLQLLLLLPLLINARHIYKKGISSVLHRAPGMDALVTMGTATATLYSLFLYARLLLHGGTADGLYFGSAGMILTFVMLGKALEENSRNKAAMAIRSLLSLRPQTATLVRGDETVEVAAASLLAGDEILVKPGEKYPADGIVSSGTGDADESLLTGESLPVTKTEGDKVFCGAVNLNGAMRVLVTGSAKQTLLAGIIKTVEQAQASKAPIAKLADKVSAVFAPTVFCIALLAGIGWFFATKDPAKAVSTFISVLVVACPCALGLATPTAIIAATGRGAKDGILIRNGETLQKLARVDTAVFDKTGTLTSGLLSVQFVECVGVKEAALLSLAAAAESVSEHPAAKAVCKYAKEKGIAADTPQHFTAVPGRGILATVNGSEVAAGNAAFLQEQSIAVPEVFADKRQGMTLIYIAKDKSCIGVIGAADTVREEAALSLQQLKAMHIRTVLVTGDNRAAAENIRRQLPIDEIHAEVLPEGKSSVLESLRKEGRTTVFIGDGINDAPALASADIGLAMGSGTDVAMETADAVLLQNDLRGVAQTLSLSARTMRIIKQNLVWAFGYNLLMIPSAAGLLTLFGLPMPNPILAAAAMSFSSVAVVTNSLRLLKNKKIRSNKK